MPPKPKVTKEEVAAAALTIIKEQGVEALTARNLGNRLGTSARPIFTAFKSMEEVKWAAREIALREFEEYISDFAEYKPAFKRIGMQMISYAIHEPELFKLLFMQEHQKGMSFGSFIKELGSMTETCIILIQTEHQISGEEARIVFEQMWMHAFGIGALCSLKVCDFTEEEISDRLSQVFTGMLLLIKSGKMKEGFKESVLIKC